MFFVTIFISFIFLLICIFCVRMTKSILLSFIFGTWSYIFFVGAICLSPTKEFSLSLVDYFPLIERVLCISSLILLIAVVIEIYLLIKINNTALHVVHSIFITILLIITCTTAQIYKLIVQEYGYYLYTDYENNKHPAYSCHSGRDYEKYCLIDKERKITVKVKNYKIVLNEELIEMDRQNARDTPSELSSNTD